MKRGNGTRIALVILVLMLARTDAAEFFIAPGGNDSDLGNITSPWGTFDCALNRLAPGDRLWVRGGQYNLDTQIVLGTGQAGSATTPIRVWNYLDEVPVLDFSSMTACGEGAHSRRPCQTCSDRRNPSKCCRLSQ